MHDIGWGWWLVMSIGMVAFWGLVIYGIVLLVRGQPQPPRQEPPEERPEDILKRRLARGDISPEQYRELQDALARPPEDHREQRAA